MKPWTAVRLKLKVKIWAFVKEQHRHIFCMIYKCKVKCVKSVIMGCKKYKIQMSLFVCLYLEYITLKKLFPSPLNWALLLILFFLTSMWHGCSIISLSRQILLVAVNFLDNSMYKHLLTLFLEFCKSHLVHKMCYVAFFCQLICVRSITPELKNSNIIYYY